MKRYIIETLDEYYDKPIIFDGLLLVKIKGCCQSAYGNEYYVYLTENGRYVCVDDKFTDFARNKNRRVDVFYNRRDIISFFGRGKLQEKLYKQLSKKLVNFWEEVIK